MRKYKFVAIALFLLMLIVPYMALFVREKTDKPKDYEIPHGMSEVFEMDISLYRTKTEEVQTLNCYEYICGVVAGEMSANYEKEALKAQTVAAFTYMINKMNYVIQNPDSDIGHNGAYMCDDYSHCKAYLPKNDALKKWGNDWFEKYYPNIEQAVSSSLGKIITCDGQPVNAVFHSISNGVTCSAKEVWGTDISYLQSVECKADKEAKDYQSVATFTHKEFSDVFYEQLGVVLPSDYENWLGNITLSDSGMVDEITIADTAYDGTYIRKLFKLRSSTFDIEITDDEVIFTVYGYGHGVGMSQNGANQMAKSGDTYEEILKHFYSGVKIEDYKV